MSLFRTAVKLLIRFVFVDVVPLCPGFFALLSIPQAGMPERRSPLAPACGIRVHRGARVASQQSPILRMDRLFLLWFIVSCKRDLPVVLDFSPPASAGVVPARPPISHRALSRSPRPGLPVCPWAPGSRWRCANAPCCNAPRIGPPPAGPAPHPRVSWDGWLAPLTCDASAPVCRWIADNTDWSAHGWLARAG